MRNYIKSHGKLLIRRGSLLDWIIMNLIPASIGSYEIVRVGRETNWGVFSFRKGEQA